VFANCTGWSGRDVAWAEEVMGWVTEFGPMAMSDVYGKVYGSTKMIQPNN
jgi:hypothetical protein